MCPSQPGGTHSPCSRPGDWGVPLPPQAQPAGGRGQTGVTGPTLVGTPTPSSAHTSSFVSRARGSTVSPAAAPGPCCSAGCFPPYSHHLFLPCPNEALPPDEPTKICLSVCPSTLCISLYPSPGCISIPRAGADGPLLGTSLGIFLTGQRAQPPPDLPHWVGARNCLQQLGSVRLFPLSPAPHHLPASSHQRLLPPNHLPHPR